MATTSSPSPASVREPSGVDHQSVGGFCACCGAVHPCAAARRQAREQPSVRADLIPMSRLARLRDESEASGGSTVPMR